MTKEQKKYIESHLGILTEREREFYRAMLPVWCEDIKRVKCPEELIDVINYRISLTVEDDKKTKRKKRK